MTAQHLAPLFHGLFDDAAMYPPQDMKMPAAIRQHARHRLSWYADTVGPFVCNSRLVPELAALVDELGLAPLEFAAVVAEGITGLPALQMAVAEYDQLVLRAVEVPLKQERVPKALAALEALRGQVPCYLEIPIGQVDERQVHELSGAGIRLKLRTGGTSIDAFRTEAELATPIVMCAAERLQFKCTAGLHHAVRHCDPQTTFEHHGFLNVALAARTAAATGNAAATAAVLAERDLEAIAYQTQQLSDRDVTAVRAMFCSFGTCSIDEPIEDLLQMGLIQK